MAGLSCACRLAGEGVQVLVLEKEGCVGGLAASHTRRGFTYDLGPHRFSSENESVNRLVKDILHDELITVERKSEIYFNNRFLLYPLDMGNIVTTVTKNELVKYVCDYVLARMSRIVSRGGDDSFESWVVRRYGRKMYQAFFGVYTEKVLGIPPARISSDWAKQRIAIPSLWDALVHPLLKRKRCHRRHVSKFVYPRH